MTCKEGSFFNACNGCAEVPDLETIEPEKYYGDALKSGCYDVPESGGYGFNTLDYMLNEVTDAVSSEMAKRGSRLTKDRTRTGLLGYSLGGLFTCHAAWGRPEQIGKAMCQSASFWWPWTFDEEKLKLESQYEFLNGTLKGVGKGDGRETRPHQQVLIDVGAREEWPSIRVSREGCYQVILIMGSVSK